MELEIVEIYDKKKFGTGFFLNVRLKDLLQCLNNEQKAYHWTILDLEGSGSIKPAERFLFNSKFYPIGDFERKIVSSPNGISLSYEQLMKLDSLYDQITSVLIVGNKKYRETINERTDEEYQKKNDIVLQIFDCSFAIVSSHSDDLIQEVKRNFIDVREIEYFKH